jgi:uridine kinase
MPSGLDGCPDPVTSPARREVLEQVAAAVIAAAHRSVTLVAIDGIDGAGKSTFADELVPILRALGRPVVRSTTDLFHNPRRIRWAKGKLSPTGFYLDSHDLPVLQELLLDPLSDDPPRPFRAAAFDEPTDSPVDAPTEEPEPGLVLLFDGLFLQRPELRRYWDFVVYLDGEQRVTDQRIERATSSCPAGPAAFLHLGAYWAVLGRYVHGFDLYRQACAPRAHADAVVDNNDLLAPTLTLTTERRDRESR